MKPTSLSDKMEESLATGRVQLGNDANTKVSVTERRHSRTRVGGSLLTGETRTVPRLEEHRKHQAGSDLNTRENY